MSADKPSFIKIAKGAKVTGLTATNNTVIGNADFINNEGSLDDATLERNHMYPGDETWVDQYDKRLNPPSHLSWFGSTLVWLKEHVLASVIIAVITAGLTVAAAFLISRLPTHPSETSSTTAVFQSPKVPVINKDLLPTQPVPNPQ